MAVRWVLAAVYIRSSMEKRELSLSTLGLQPRRSENGDTRDLEVLAIIATLEHYRPVIDGQRLKVISDHKNLKWLMDQKNPSGRLGRWVLRLSEFDFELEYRKGARMQIADCLSRNSQRDSEWREDDEEMPAGIIKSEDLFVTKSSAEMLVVQLEKGLCELSLSTLLEEGLGGEVLAAYGAGVPGQRAHGGGCTERTFCISPPPGHLCGPYFKVTARTNNGNPAVLFSQCCKPHLANWQKKCA